MTHLAALRRMWIEVQPSEERRELAQEIIQRHPLRVADALQLAVRRRCLGPDGGLTDAAGRRDSRWRQCRPGE
jgi:hypothetical protein